MDYIYNMKEQYAYAELEEMDHVEYIKEEIYLSDNVSAAFPHQYPHKSDATIACILVKGEIKGQISQFPVSAKAPGLLVLLPGQVRQLEQTSDDFEGRFILMAKQFIESISLPENFSAYMSIYNVPYISFEEKTLEAILNYYQMLTGVLRNRDEGFNRQAIIKHLTIDFFYGLGYYLHKLDHVKKTRSEITMGEFLKLVQKYYKQERSLGFYADKLCITSKYLSLIVKNVSGKTARQWIDDYTILEAKALIKSTEMTILQISGELNFPSQSFFGKFFKREVGMSPKQYREIK